MTTFLEEAAKKLAEQWVRLLVLPGLLLVAAAIAVWPLTGWSRDTWYPDWTVERVGQHLDGIAERVQQGGGITMALLLVGVLLASMALGYVATFFAWLIEQLWLGVWESVPTTRRRTQRRRAAWDARNNEVAAALSASPLDPDALRRARQRRSAIAFVRPQRATWMGDRLAAVEKLTEGTYGLRLRPAWPRLWLVMPDHARKEIQSAAEVFGRQSLIAGWGLVVLAAAVFWLPFGVPGVLLVIVGRVRAARRLASYADLVESAVDLYIADLARSVGLAVTGQVVPADGRNITAIADKTV